MGRVSLQNQVQHSLVSKARIGESRHAAKAELKDSYAAKGEKMPFGTPVEGVHSIKTFKDYKAIGERFAAWCVQEKGVSKYAKIDTIRQYATEYLKGREAEGKSLYTLKTERAALGKIFGEPISCTFERPRTTKEITRSRGEKVRDTHFSEERNKDLVTIAKATGARREDIAKMSAKDFFQDQRGNLWVRIEQSKGGRDRVAPVLPSYRPEVERILSERQNSTLFDKIHNGADIHSYRREYAKELYSLVKEDQAKAADYKALYGPRNEPNIKGDMYHSHDKERPFHGARNDIYIVSEALGHNRLDVTVSHYLK